MTQHSQYPLWGANRAFVIVEALDLVAGAGCAETAWSRRNEDENCAVAQQHEHRSRQRGGALLTAIAMIGGVAVLVLAG